MKNITLAYWAIFFACIIWWMNGVFVNLLHFPSVQQTFFRLLIPAVVTFFILFYQKESISLVRNEIFQRHFLIISSLNALRMFLLISGYVAISIGSATIVQKTSTFLVVIMAYFLLHESITWQKILSIILGFIGILFIVFEKWFSLEWTQFFGVMLVFLSAILSSYLNIAYKKNISSGSTMLIFQQSFFGMVLFGVISAVLYDFPTGLNLLLACLHSFLIGVVWFYFFFFSVKYLEIGVVSILNYFEIISAMFFWFLFLNQIPSIFSYLWMLAIIASGFILIFFTKSRKTNLS